MSETTKEMPDQQTEESDESQAVSNLKPNKNIIYPRREKKPPSYLNGYITNVQDQADQVMYGTDCCYKLSGFRDTFKEAIESPDAKH